jgi:hypothetical protein
MPIKDERGYLIVAYNTGSVDYVSCAEACAKSIRLHTPNAKIAILGNDNIITEASDVFDFKIPAPYPVGENGFEVDWQIAWASPFRQTIKIEADMIIPHSIDHWWTMLEKKDVVLTIGARDVYGNASDVRYYRKVFDENNLPDVYNAITYWRYSKTAIDFFTLVRNIFQNWKEIQPSIKLGLSDVGTTDLVYAIAAKMFGVEEVTLPNTSYPTLVHMRGKINNLIQEDWTKELTWELDKSHIRINTIDQIYPFHYIVKGFSKELNEHYKQFF